MSDGSGTLAAPNTRSNETRRASTGTNAVVTLIEDDDDIREALESLLSHAGYSVLPYASAELALRDMEGGHHPDLILLDLMMPGMNGWQFRVEQRRRPALSDIPVIALSADVSPYAAAIDADAYLKKPVDFDRLCTVIEQVILATERKQLAAKAVELERIRALGLLVAGVAHEINNPLTYVLGNLELAATRQRTLIASPDRAAALAPKLLENIESAHDGAERIAFIVRLLSTFVRGGKDDTQPADVARAADAAVRLAMQHIRTRARMTVEIDESMPPVRANEARLAQVFLNLLINAAQAIPEGTPDKHEICLRAAAQNGKIVIEVEDTGCGIAPELTARIFEPFYTTKPADQGTGLGLSISRDVIVGLGGSITVTSELGQGATFRIELPVLAQETGGESDPASRQTDLPALGRQRILVLDDEPLIGDFLTGALDEHHVEVTTEASEALKRVADGRYDLVLCDLRMPRMSGIEFYAELVKRRPDLGRAFVLMTGAAIDDELSRFLSSQDVPILRKPFDMNELTQVVARFAKSSRAARARRAS